MQCSISFTAQKKKRKKNKPAKHETKHHTKWWYLDTLATMMDCGSHQVFLIRPTGTGTETESNKHRGDILKWNTVNYVLCEIITGAIVVCMKCKWLYFISSSILLPPPPSPPPLLTPPPTPQQHTAKCQVVYICVKYYCNNNGNNLFMSFSFHFAPFAVCWMAGWLTGLFARASFVLFVWVYDSFCWGFCVEQTVELKFECFLSLSISLALFENEPFINALNVLCSE